MTSATGLAFEAYSRLEKRVAEHIVVLQPRLTRQQRERLLGLCTPDGESRSRDPWPVNWGPAAALDITLLSPPFLGESL